MHDSGHECCLILNTINSGGLVIDSDLSLDESVGSPGKDGEEEAEEEEGIDEGPNSRLLFLQLDARHLLSHEVQTVLVMAISEVIDVIPDN